MSKFFYYAHVLSPVLGLLVNIVTQLLKYRFGKTSGLLQSVFFGFFSGFLAVFIIELAYFSTAPVSSTDLIGYGLLNSIAYAAFGYCYFHFINLGETARRVRIVREFWESQTELSMDELIGRYNASEIIDVRLQRMIRNKQIIEKDRRYYIGNPVMLYMAKLIVLMKQILLGKKGENF